MLFQRPPQTAEDIRAFCARFGEGLRVEYKSVLDNSVRSALPKILSSLANSQGGVVIVGVRAANGVPITPIEGFEAPAEELPLTIENLCIQGTNPPVFPRSTVIDSDVDGRVFLVIEVDESWEAPHAIENSKRVYVRTGNAANPYELAEVDLIIELVRRRARPEALKSQMLEAARVRANRAVSDTQSHVEVSISPLYPSRPLATRDATWDFLAQQYYRGAHFFPFESLRRVNDGTASHQPHHYGQLNNFGVALMRVPLRDTAQNHLVAEPLHPALKLAVMANRFYSSTNCRGNVEFHVRLSGMLNRRLIFVPTEPIEQLAQQDFRCHEEAISASQIVAAPNLGVDLVRTLQELFCQLCWPCWQSVEAFPADTLRTRIESLVRTMGLN